ncbi:MAG: helix-turn-helix transcriptional regulator [Planctomycetales bacterium]
MKTALESSDGEFLNDLHRHGPGTVHQICEAVGVTATAVRQRLTRLQGAGLVERQRVRTGRGRPHFVYRVTDKGLRQLGDNYGDLALILWREIHQIEDPQARTSITTRVRDALVARLGRFTELPLDERLRRLSDALIGRGYDVELGLQQNLPILRENNCPYQELAEEDRGICGLEREVFQQVLEVDVRLTRCCLDGHHCCEFEIGTMDSQSVAVPATIG